MTQFLEEKGVVKILTIFKRKDANVLTLARCADVIDKLAYQDKFDLKTYFHVNLNLTIYFLIRKHAVIGLIEVIVS